LIKHRPFIVDVEASGFGQESYPIEIGLALAKNERYCSLITPPASWTHWDKKAEQVHQITQEALKNHGNPIQKVARDLNHILKDTTIYSDGWVVDKPWITKLFTKAQIPKLFFISPLERILTEPQMEIWHKTKDRITLQTNLTRHRASSDSFIIQETFMQTLAETS
jgi:hypothetical protein